MTKELKTNAKPVSPEELERQRARFFLQKREAFAQGILYNLCQNVRIADLADTETIVTKSVEMADLLLERIYGIELKEK